MNRQFQFKAYNERQTQISTGVSIKCQQTYNKFFLCKQPLLWVKINSFSNCFGENCTKVFSSHLYVAPTLAGSTVTTTANLSPYTYVMSLCRLCQGTCLLCKMNWVYKMASFVNQFNIGTTAIVSQGALKNYE